MLWIERMIMMNTDKDVDLFCIISELILFLFVFTAAKIICEYPDRLCKNDSTSCVRAEKLCDGVRDCADGSDEGRLCG